MKKVCMVLSMRPTILLIIRVYEGVIEGTNYFTNCPIFSGGIMTTKIKEMNISLRSEIDYFLTIWRHYSDISDWLVVIWLTAIYVYVILKFRTRASRLLLLSPGNLYMAILFLIYDDEWNIKYCPFLFCKYINNLTMYYNINNK